MLDLWNVLDDVMRNDPWFKPFPMGPESRIAGTWLPADVAETDTAYVVSAELPGVNIEDVKLEIEQGVLTLSAQKRPKSEQDRHDSLRVERRYGTFTRSFTLPRAVATDDIRATMKDGVLTVHLPKAEQARARRVPIQTLAPLESPAPAQLSEASESKPVAS